MRKALYILGDLNDQDIIYLAETGTVQNVEEGATLINAGEPIRAVYFVTDGEFTVRSIDGSVVAELGVGDVIGEMSFVESQPPDVDVVAKIPSRVLAVPRDALMAELGQNAEFGGRFYKALATFLSDRLRSMTPRGQEGELDDRLLDIMHIAGDRLHRLIEMLEAKR